MVAEALVAAVFFALTCHFGVLTVKPLKGLTPSIFFLEVTLTVRSSNAILSAWRQQKPDRWKDLLLQSLDRDTWFIFSYAPLLALWCWMSAHHLARFWPELACYVRMLAFAQIFAGICDFIENYGLRRTIMAEAASAPRVQITGTASIVKWILIAAGGVVPLCSFIHFVFEIIRR